MGDAGLIAIGLFVCICAGAITHSLAMRRKWLAVLGVLAICAAVGLVCYFKAATATDWDVLGWAIVAVLGALPATIGGVMGFATGTWFGRRR